MKKLLCLLAATGLLLSACTSNLGETPAQKRQAIRDMRQEVLEELYQLKPDVRTQIRSAAGYGVFSNLNVKIIFASGGGGYGIVRDNASGGDTYMKMGEVGLGLGLGIKDFRAVFVFHNKATLDQFVNSGWAFGAQADAAAKASDKGGAVGAEAQAGNITIYQLTETGLALQATVKGTKYWKDDSLN